MPNKTNNNVLANNIVELIIKRIKDKEFLPGDKLPGERDLANELGVARSSLREALRILDHMNILEVKPAMGTFVTSLEIESLVEPIEFTFALDDNSVLKVFETRRTLELKTAELAAQYVTMQDIKELDVLFAKMTDDTKPIAYREEVDREFHMRIASFSRNPLLYRFVCVVLEAMINKRQESYSLPNAVYIANQEHKHILQHLRAHEVDSARHAMLNHLDTTEQNLLKLVKKKGFVDHD